MGDIKMTNDKIQMTKNSSLREAQESLRGRATKQSLYDIDCFGRPSSTYFLAMTFAGVSNG